MLTVTLAQTGPAWIGRKKYKVTLESPLGHVAFTDIGRRDAYRIIRDTCIKMIAEDRPFRMATLLQS